MAQNTHNKKIFTLSEFAREVENAEGFTLSYNYPLSPESFALDFDNMSLRVGGPYLAFWNESKSCALCLGNIKEIYRCGAVYTIICNQFSTLSKEPPTEQEFTLKIRSK